MPRGRKKTGSLEEQLEQITANIDEMEAALKELKKTKKQLEERVGNEKLTALDALITEKGLTYEQVIEMLG